MRSNVIRSPIITSRPARAYFPDAAAAHELRLCATRRTRLPAGAGEPSPLPGGAGRPHRMTQGPDADGRAVAAGAAAARPPRRGRPGRAGGGTAGVPMEIRAG